jgi:hypothetical protein
LKLSIKTKNANPDTEECKELCDQWNNMTAEQQKSDEGKKTERRAH